MGTEDSGPGWSPSQARSPLTASSSRCLETPRDKAQSRPSQPVPSLQVSVPATHCSPSHTSHTVPCTSADLRTIQPKEAGQKLPAPCSWGRWGSRQVPSPTQGPQLGQLGGQADCQLLTRLGSPHPAQGLQRRPLASVGPWRYCEAKALAPQSEAVAGGKGPLGGRESHIEGHWWPGPDQQQHESRARVRCKGSSQIGPWAPAGRGAS